MNIQRSLNILGLGRDASPRSAKSAYRKLVKIHHPDRFANHSSPDKIHIAEENIKQINTAYSQVKSYFSSNKPSEKNTPEYAIRKKAYGAEKHSAPSSSRKNSAVRETVGLKKTNTGQEFKKIFKAAVMAQKAREAYQNSNQNKDTEISIPNTGDCVHTTYRPGRYGGVECVEKI